MPPNLPRRQTGDKKNIVQHNESAIAVYFDGGKVAGALERSGWSLDEEVDIAAGIARRGSKDGDRLAAMRHIRQLRLDAAKAAGLFAKYEQERTYEEEDGTKITERIRSEGYVGHGEDQSFVSYSSPPSRKRTGEDDGEHGASGGDEDGDSGGSVSGDEGCERVGRDEDAGGLQDLDDEGGVDG